ncbi:MAG: glycan biosynthesis hexose transferase WsfD, partial [Ruminiclostridium sp.]
MNTHNQKDDWTVTRRILLNLKKIVITLKAWIDIVNKNREGKYTPTFIGWGGALVSAILLIVMLFVPPYLGMSDDGSFAREANPVGIYHMDNTDEDLYFNYYVKEYLTFAPDGASQVSISSQRLLIYAAKAIDAIFTHDNIFDLRFLALLYGILFIPAIALLIKQAAIKAKTFSESVVIGILGVLIFADVSYITYFSSFYTKPIMYIGIMLCVGAALALQEEKHNARYLIIYTISGILLTTSENQCATIGIFLGILSVGFIFINKNALWRLGCICSVLLLFVSVMVSIYYIPSTYNQASKYHAMTRGVLLQATDPERALKEFGINSSYAVLTDTSSYDYYPFVNPDNKVLE